MRTEIVSQDDIKELTGSPKSSKQIEVLTRHHIKFIVRTDGKIRTTWTAINNALTQQPSNDDDGPDLDFLRT